MHLNPNLSMNAYEIDSPPPAHPSSDTSRIRVAVVEDDASVRHILCDWIQHTEDFECIDHFADAELAVTSLARHEPHVALIDINLPGMSGIECVRRLKPLLPNTQFVMLTVYEDSNHIFDALAAGATGYLLKRTLRESLLNALREVHSGGSPMSSNIARKVVQSLQQARPKGKAADSLSPRENEVLALLAQGYLYKEIADSIRISLPTVNTYIRRIYEKLHVHSRAQAVALYADLPLRGAIRT
jgi:DNA-binding NarL/FixJ family response regulator